MGRIAIAFGLGFVSFLLMMAVGEGAGMFPAAAALAGYTGLCQFLLSRGHRNALPGDWRTMLALNAVMLGAVVLMALVEKREVVYAQAPTIVIGCGAGTLGGALLAMLFARRAGGRD